MLTPNREMKAPRKKKPKKLIAPSTEQPVNAISETHTASPTPLPLPPAETVNQSNEISKQIEASNAARSASVVSAEKQTQRSQKQVSNDQEKKAKRRKNKPPAHGMQVATNECSDTDVRLV